MTKNRFAWEVRPVAEEKNIVKEGNSRFTILTDRLIRMEYDPAGNFTDKASQTVFYRDFPACDYTVRKEENVLIIETASCILRYCTGEPFSAETLSVSLKEEPASTWYYGEEIENLGGTAETLDGINDEIALGDGVCSRLGIAVLEDSDSMLLGEDGWVEVRPENTIDLYFFGYGYDYKESVRDYYRLTGIPPLLPAYALGNWWSRYYKYTQKTYLDLMDRFRKEDIPFSVAVVDMDWHLTEELEEGRIDDRRFKPGWTGYTWNKEFFPDYKEFLREIKERNLKTALNLHPAQGVACHEEQYEEMARAMGIDPESKERVPFDILSQEFMANYFDILHHPYEEDGVDFWWMDWQQGTDYWWIHEPNQEGELKDPREVLNPLWMINHLHILDISRNGKRPMFFSRFSGPGSQRYPIGFSGDTFITWEALKFQPYFTSTASNVGYGWWSHDIGGHMRGCYDEELITRWIQLGVFSPINRLHSSNLEFLHKEPWYFGEEYRKVMEDTLRLRHRLFPYLYSMNYRCHLDLEPLVQPMYYSHPKCGEAYNSPNQYWFGSELMVGAVSEKCKETYHLAETSVWLPQGDWFDFFNGLHYAAKKARRIKTYRALNEYPVFARAGAIVPMMIQPAHENRLSNSENMEIIVFPGASNQFTLYEDAGDGYEYQNGDLATTRFSLDFSPLKAEFTIAPAAGDLSLIPEKRNWNIKLRGWHKDMAAAVKVDGSSVQCETKYLAEENTLCVIVSADVTAAVTVSLSAENLIHDNADWLERSKKILLHSRLTPKEKDRLFSILQLADVDVHRKMTRMYIGEAFDYDVILALRELLTLTETEF